MAPAKRSAPRTVVRGEPVVQDVLDATMAELAEVGYRALRIDDVAARAGVHKTTVYRRWPEKSDLVREALARSLGETPAPDTGSFRDDLLALARHVVDVCSSTFGASTVRMVMAEHNEKDVRKLVDTLRRTKEEPFLHVLRRARARGELRADADDELILAMLVGTLQHVMFAMGERATEALVERLVDTIVEGVGRRPKRR
ncbi:MAG: TetR/AcrR family transcriptional regulator [Deltaproteobacteria bacterium]|nr:TetR/AcrR family transcriptional regulator [Deltaproteobacteria bacterium]